DGGANVDTLGGNVEAGGNVALSGCAKIYGNATAVGTISVGVTGTSTPGAAPVPVPPNLTCPAAGYTPVVDVSANSHATYNAGTGYLNVSSGNLTLPYPAGGVYYFSTVNMSGTSTLTMN